MNRKMIANELLKLAKELLALEFDNKEQMEKYKKDHDVRPGTKMTVKQDKKPLNKPGKSKSVKTYSPGKEIIPGFREVPQDAETHRAPAYPNYEFVLIKDPSDKSVQVWDKKSSLKVPKNYKSVQEAVNSIGNNFDLTDERVEYHKTKGIFSPESRKMADRLHDYIVSVSKREPLDKKDAEQWSVGFMRRTVKLPEGYVLEGDKYVFKGGK